MWPRTFGVFQGSPTKRSNLHPTPYPPGGISAIIFEATEPFGRAGNDDVHRLSFLLSSPPVRAIRWTLSPDRKVSGERAVHRVQEPSCTAPTTGLHMQEFDPVAPRIDEHIDTAVKRIFPHLRTDKSAEGVKALTHIGRRRPEPISETVVQAKHCPRWCEASPR